MITIHEECGWCRQGIFDEKGVPVAGEDWVVYFHAACHSEMEYAEEAKKNLGGKLKLVGPGI